MATALAEAPNSEMDCKACRLYLFLFNNGAMTSAQIADMMGIDMTQTYNLLSILSDRELIMAIPAAPIKFVALPNDQLSVSFKLKKINMRIIQCIKKLVVLIL